MEHDPESSLSAKIRSVESQPVLWRKHDVWSAVQDNIRTTKRRSYVFQYAAAVIVLMLVLSHPLRHAPNITASTSISDFTVAPTVAPPAEKRSEAVATAKIVVDETRSGSSDHQMEDRIDTQALVSPLENNEEEVASAGPGIIARESEPDLIAMDAEFGQLVAAPRIKVIVGVVSPTDDHTEIRKRKKKLFHKLDRLETKDHTPEIHPIVVARLK